MSSAYTYPGVYIQELPSPVHSIAGVATSIAAFVGYTARGIDNRAQAIYSFSDFQRLYGGLASNSEVSYAVQQFYQNGGSQAYVVRTPMHYAPTVAVPTPEPYASVEFGILTFTALSSGQWANGNLLVDVDVQGLDLSTATGDPLAFNLTITSLSDKKIETFPAVTLNYNFQNFVQAVVNDVDNGSQLVNVSADLPASPALPSALEISGLLGTALTMTAVNTALGASTSAANADCSLNLTLPVRSGTTITPGDPLTIKVISNTAPIPQTVAGLAAQLQQAINTALAINVPGASVVCSAAPNGSPTTLGIRVNALLPNQPDAVITFGAPTVPAGSPAVNDISAALGLSAPTTSNVAHYALGTGIGSTFPVQGAETTSTAATAPVSLPGDTELIGDPLSFSGIYALLKVPIFNMLSIPEAARAQPGNPTAADPAIHPVDIYSAAIQLCDEQRALLLIDPPANVNTVSAAVDWKTSTLDIVDPNGAAFFPRLRLSDQLNKGQLRTFAPSGVVAGVYAKTDGASGCVEGSCRDRRHPERRAEYGLSAQRRRKWHAQSTGPELLPHLPHLRPGSLGFAYAGGRRCHGQPVEVRPRATHRVVP